MNNLLIKIKCPYCKTKGFTFMQEENDKNTRYCPECKKEFNMKENETDYKGNLLRR